MRSTIGGRGSWLRISTAVGGLCLAVLASVATAADGGGEVTIYRDTWGVPHIYADGAGPASYGHGYAQAEDRLEDVLAGYLIATGQAARVLGGDRVESDYIARLARHAEISRSHYAELGEDTRVVIEHFVAGVRAYMSEHPERVPAWAPSPRPFHVVALFRAFSYAWPVGQVRGDLRRAGSHAPADRGSNQMVVGAARSAEDVPIAIIDPHLSWKPENRFYESHVHGGDLSFFGFSIIGTPVMALGHTDYFSVAFTTGGPDCADVYEERIHPDDPLKYEYDGQWRPIRVEEIELEFLTAEGLQRATRRVERTHHGPILKRAGDRAFAAKTAYDGEFAAVDQWVTMVKARNLGEFLHALRMNQTLPQNVMYADVYGNTFYLRAGRVPRRPEGYRWDRPVPGWTSQTEWLGMHELPDLVQILNPPTGYMQNCNVSPGTMMPDSPLSADRYPDYIYNIEPDRSNTRGRRALQLLASPEKLDVDDVLRIAMDTYVEQSGSWQRALAAATETHAADFEDLAPAVKLLASWDGHADVDSRAAALFRFWMRACRREGSGVPMWNIDRDLSVTEVEQAALLEALRDAVASMQGTAGRIDAAWGELHRIRRGVGSWPVGGCSADGIGTLRSVRMSAPDERGVSYAEGGQFATMVVVLEEGAVRSFSANPFGQSDDPDSPHYADQAARLFSAGELKPTWYGKAALMQHVESRTTLSVPKVSAEP